MPSLRKKLIKLLRAPEALALTFEQLPIDQSGNKIDLNREIEPTFTEAEFRQAFKDPRTALDAPDIERQFIMQPDAKGRMGRRVTPLTRFLMEGKKQNKIIDARLKELARDARRGGEEFNMGTLRDRVIGVDPQRQLMFDFTPGEKEEFFSKASSRARARSLSILRDKLLEDFASKEPDTSPKAVERREREAVAIKSIAERIRKEREKAGVQSRDLDPSLSEVFDEISRLVDSGELKL